MCPLNSLAIICVRSLIGEFIKVSNQSRLTEPLYISIQQSGAASIVLIETPWVDGKAWGVFAEEDENDLSRSSQQAVQYARAGIQVGSR